jgi:hypothetical protein
LAEEIAELNVGAFNCPVLPRKQDDAVAKTFRYEGYDIITLQKLVEREYHIPEPQTAEEVIGYYARRIAQDVKLPSQFAALAPKVREFLETKAFGERVVLNEPTMIKAISSNVAQYVTVKTLLMPCAKWSYLSCNRSFSTPGAYCQRRRRFRGRTPRSPPPSLSSIWFPVTMNSKRSLRCSCRRPRTWTDLRSSQSSSVFY